MQELRFKKCQVQIKYEMEAENNAESSKVSKVIGLKDFNKQEWMPRLVIGFCQFIQSMGFPLVYVTPILTGEGIMLSSDPEQTLENVYQTLEILEEGIEEGAFDYSDEQPKEYNSSLQKHLEPFSKASKVLDYDSFVKEFLDDDSFKNFMYKLYVEEVSA